MTIVFENSSIKYPNKAFLVPNLGIFVFHTIVHLDKFEGADFKYGNIFFSNSSPKIPKLHIFDPKFRHFFFAKFAIGEIWGADFKYDNNIFQIAAKKYPNKAFLVRNLRTYIFAPNFATRQIPGQWFETWQ